MFEDKKTQNQPLIPSDQKEVAYQFDYESIMQFIKQNKEIPQQMNLIRNSEAAQKHMDTLFNAIMTGDLKNEIFSDKQCQIYSLYLLKEKRISYDDFLTINLYLIILMVYTEQQNLAPGDVDLKRKIEIEIGNIAEENTSKLFYKKLSEHFFTNFLNNSKNLNFEEFSEYLNRLSPLDQCVFKISKLKKSAENDEVVNQTARYANSPFIGEDKFYYYIPSAKIIMKFLSILNNEIPVKPAAIFGRISLSTLFALHRQGLHPIALYSPFIKSNLYKVHDKRCGPLAAFLHDMGGHLYFGNLLAKNEYDFIFQYWLPLISEQLKLLVGDLDPKARFFNIVDLNFTKLSKKNLFLYCLLGAFEINNDLDADKNPEKFIAIIKTITQQQNRISQQYQLSEDPVTLLMNAYDFSKLELNIKGGQ